jgi:tetratricopeptide (TPR) repeat protein
MNRRRQPQRTPPPVTSGSEALEGDIVLQELEGDLSLCLWKTARTVRLWAELPPELQSRAFSPPSYAERISQIGRLELDADLREALETAAEVLRGGAGRAAAVSDACGRISRWAEAQGSTGTALELAQAAALSQGRQAALGLEVARIAAERGEIARAESWYRQAIFTARQTRDWTSFATAFMGQGKLHFRRGDATAARTSFLRALRISRRHSLGQLAAEACHRILEVAILARRASEVDRYARAALQAYRGNREGLIGLARTLALYLVERGFHAEARQLFQLIPEDAGKPADRLSRVSALAQAGAALGDVELYGATMETLRALLETPELDGSTASWIGLLRAAAWAADSAAAETLEPRARAAAEQLGDSDALEEIAWLADPGAEPPDLKIRRASASLRSLVTDLEEALERSARPG